MKKNKLLHQWECPHSSVYLLKLETVLLAFLVFLIYILSYLIFNQSWTLALIITLFFLIIFFGIKWVIRHFYPIKNQYQLKEKHLIIKRIVGKITEEVSIPYSEIKGFKLDKRWHGGRIHLKNQVLLLYFNSRDEVEKLEKILLQKIKKN